MEKVKKQFTLQNLIEFIKLQLAGNILFWGTYFGFFLLYEVANWTEVLALAVASVIAHVMFFIANSEWVFDEKGERRKSSGELTRFVVFMGVNYFINLGIIYALSHFFSITPYIGQFISALFFTLWTFIGLKYWVFSEAHRHASLRARGKKHVNPNAAK
jgi:putative flippase GtrA